MDAEDEAALSDAYERFIGDGGDWATTQDVFEAGFCAGMDHGDVKRRDEAIIEAHRQVRN